MLTGPPNQPMSTHQTHDVDLKMKKDRFFNHILQYGLCLPWLRLSLGGRATCFLCLC